MRTTIRPHIARGRTKLLLLAISCGIAAQGAASGQSLAPPSPTYAELHAFSGAKDGGIPFGGLVRGTDGALYGTASRGGFQNNGVVFKLEPPVPPATQWALTTLYAFKGLNVGDGSAPEYGGLAFDSDGALYGTTSAGGTLDMGTVFKLAPPVPPSKRWTETVLHSFIGNDDGSLPLNGVAVNTKGELFGVTATGGAAFHGVYQNAGMVFKLAPPVPPATQWTNESLHSFTGLLDGRGPSGVVFDTFGALYGTAGLGGAHDQGLVFKLAPPTPPATQWTLSALHSFSGDDGANPSNGVIFGPGGALFGVTYAFGVPRQGVVFQVAPPAPPATQWTGSVLHAFTGGNDGFGPAAGLVFGTDGALYGTTERGGAGALGTAFKMTPPASGTGPWRETILHSFGGADGIAPYSPLIFGANGALYGITPAGGSLSDGTVFELR